MKTKNKILIMLVVLLIVMSSFVLKKNSNSSPQVMIYGVVYFKKCSTEASLAYATKVVDVSNYYAKQEELKKELEKKYPESTRVRVNSSKNDYGNSASNSCVISWTKTNNNCTYKVIGVYFGVTKEGALNKAIEEKSKWGGKDASYNIEEQEFWLK